MRLNPFLSTSVDMVGVSWDWGREAKTMVMESCINTIKKMLLTHAAQYKMPAKCNRQSVGQSLSACSLLKRTQMAALNPLDFCVNSTWHGLQAATTLAKYYSILQPCDGEGFSIARNAGIPSDQKQSSEWVSVKLGMNTGHRLHMLHLMSACMVSRFKASRIKGPDNATSQFLPKIRSRSWSGTGKGGKTNGGGGGSISTKVVCGRVVHEEVVK